MILVTTDSCCVIAFIRTYIENYRKISLHSQRPPDVSADPSSVNPPQYKHYQWRHTVETRAGHHFSQFSPCLSLKNVHIRNP